MINKNKMKTGPFSKLLIIHRGKQKRKVLVAETMFIRRQLPF